MRWSRARDCGPELLSRGELKVDDLAGGAGVFQDVAELLFVEWHLVDPHLIVQPGLEDSGPIVLQHGQLLIDVERVFRDDGGLDALGAEHITQEAGRRFCPAGPNQHLAVASPA